MKHNQLATHTYRMSILLLLTLLMILLRPQNAYAYAAKPALVQA